jgi:hypothetical protein
VEFTLLFRGSPRARYLRACGGQPDGHFTLGGRGYAINVGALAYGVAAIINILLPRLDSSLRYMHYPMILIAASIIDCGLMYMAVQHPYDRGSSPSGDAWKLHRARS